MVVLRRLLSPMKRSEERMAMRVRRVRAGLFALRVRAQAARARADIDLRVAGDVRIGRGVRVDLAARTSNILHIGAGVRLDDGVTIRLRGGAVHLGPHVEVRRGTIFNVSGDVQVEGPALLSWGVVIHCAESVRMERWSVATEYVTITDMAHFHTGPDRWLMDNVATRPVVVGHHAWIGPKATVTMGVTIGDHAMVGANSVVTDDVERAVLVAGAPARVIRPVGATEGDASR